MAEAPKIRSWSMEQFLAHVVRRLEDASRQRPAFTLILGAGFSYGVVPTTQQMVRHDIPWWLHCRTMQKPDDYRREPKLEGEFEAFTRELWAQVAQDCCPGLRLDNGIPDTTPANNIADAYQAVTKPEASAGLSNPDLRGRYLRDVMRKAGGKINAAHLFLSGILAAQDQPDQWKGRAPFCRTLFTTNFDPVLQQSLQLNGLLYTLTDRPYAMELPDDEESAVVNLVYAHGTVFQHILINNEDEVADTAGRNAGQFRAALQPHGVIAIGYGGWPDAVMSALEQCPSFGGNLFWCDRYPPELADQSLRRNVRDLLEKKRGSAIYVQIPSADELMIELHDRLGLGRVPRLMRQPVEQLVRQIQSLHMPNLSLGRKATPPGPGAVPGPPGIASVPAAPPGGGAGMRSDTLANFQEMILTRLAGAARVLGLEVSDEGAIATAIRDNLRSEAQHAATNGDMPKAIRLWDRVIADPDTPVEQRAESLIFRALARNQFQNFPALQTNDWNAALADFTAAAELPGITPLWKSAALAQRGFAFEARRDLEKALADYDASAAVPGAPPEWATVALVNAGNIRFKKGEKEAAVRAFTAVIDAPGAPLEQRYRALLARGLIYELKSAWEAAIDDYTRLIDTPDLTPAQRWAGIACRAVANVERGDAQAANADFAVLIDTPGAAPDVRAGLSVFRAFARGQFGEWDKAEADFAIGLANATPGSDDLVVLTIAQAFARDQAASARATAGGAATAARSDARAPWEGARHYVRAMWRAMREDIEGAVSELSAIIAMPGVPANLKAAALFSRASGHATQGDSAAAIADYTDLLQMGDVDAATKAKVLRARSAVYSTENDTVRANADIAEAAKLSPPPFPPYPSYPPPPPSAKAPPPPVPVPPAANPYL